MRLFLASVVVLIMLGLPQAESDEELADTNERFCFSPPASLHLPQHRGLLAQSFESDEEECTGGLLATIDEGSASSASTLAAPAGSSTALTVGMRGKWRGLGAHPMVSRRATDPLGFRASARTCAQFACRWPGSQLPTHATQSAYSGRTA